MYIKENPRRKLIQTFIFPKLSQEGMLCRAYHGTLFTPKETEIHL